MTTHSVAPVSNESKSGSFVVTISLIAARVTTCLENRENLEMSGNYTDVREMSGISLKVMEVSGNCRGKNLVMENCVTFIIFHFSVALDGTGSCDVIIMKSLSLNMNLTV